MAGDLPLARLVDLQGRMTMDLKKRTATQKEKKYPSEHKFESET